MISKKRIQRLAVKTDNTKNIGATAIARRLRADDLFEKAQEHWVLRKCSQASPIAWGTSKYTFLAKNDFFFAENAKKFPIFSRHFLATQ